MSRDEYIGQVARDIQNKLPAVFDLDLIHKKLGLDVAPTSVVLQQELERFNKLVVRMGRSLAELQRVSSSSSSSSGTQPGLLCATRWLGPHIGPALCRY